MFLFFLSRGCLYSRKGKSKLLESGEDAYIRDFTALIYTHLKIFHFNYTSFLNFINNFIYPCLNRNFLFWDNSFLIKRVPLKKQISSSSFDILCWRKFSVFSKYLHNVSCNFLLLFLLGCLCTWDCLGACDCCLCVSRCLGVCCRFDEIKIWLCFENVWKVFDYQWQEWGGVITVVCVVVCLCCVWHDLFVSMVCMLNLYCDLIQNNLCHHHQNIMVLCSCECFHMSLHLLWCYLI